MKHPETARRLKEALADAGMSQQELANRTGLNKSSISNYINGNIIPSNVSATRIGDVLDVDPVWLMGFDVPKNEKRHYYLDQHAAEIAQAIFENKELSLLFDAARDAKPETLSTAHALLLALKKKEEES